MVDKSGMIRQLIVYKRLKTALNVNMWLNYRNGSKNPKLH